MRSSDAFPFHLQQQKEAALTIWPFHCNCTPAGALQCKHIPDLSYLFVLIANAHVNGLQEIMADNAVHAQLPIMVRRPRSVWPGLDRMDLHRKQIAGDGKFTFSPAWLTSTDSL